MTKKILRFFDKLEDKTRAKLSHFPVLYAFLGGIGIVLFWRGVWHSADFFSLVLLSTAQVTPFQMIDGPLSLVVGILILLVTGVFVSSFIGNRLIISGLSGEKKLTEKTKEEIDAEEGKIAKLQKTLSKVEGEISKIESEIKEEAKRHHQN